MNKTWMALVVAGMVGVWACSAPAVLTGNDITINDGAYAHSGNATLDAWWWHPETPGEDQEVEPNCLVGQAWDLEGFYLDTLTLNMVGGWNFVGGYEGYSSGDVFIDVDGNLANGYSYVYDLNFAGMTYNVYGGAFTTIGVNQSQNVASNPWRYNTGGTLVGSGNIGYQTGLSSADAQNLIGTLHNVASIDLAILGLVADTEFVSHFTIQCGNDNLMGNGRIPGTPVPDGALTLALLGVALVGIEFVRRKVRG